MSEFQVYLEMGMAHIADITAYDHIVFIIALCAACEFAAGVYLGAANS